MISTNLSITNTQWPSPMGLQPTPPSSTSAVGSEVNQLLNATTQLTTSMQDTALQNKQAQDQKDRDQALKRQQTSLLATLPPPASINTTAQAPTPPTAPSLPFTPGSAVMPASPAPAPTMPRSASMPVTQLPAPSADPSNPVEWAKNVVSDAFKWLKQLPGSTAQSVAQVVTGAPAQAGTLPPNALATASPLPTMMNSTGGLIHPLAGKGTNTSGFGMRNHPTKGGQRMHTGQDVGAPEGTPIVAAAGGKVVKNANDTGGYGNYVVIEHTSGEQKIETLYGHMKAPSPLQVGASVQQGQQIGLVGSTGASTGPHLHFEVIVNGKPQDPMAYLPKGGTQKA